MFAVFAESHSGKIHTLRKFPTRDDAEDHPVIAAHWRRVWVDPVEGEIKPVRTDAPMPWTIEWTAGRAYVRCAYGHRIATLLGPQLVRDKVGAMLVEITKDLAGL
jgi:hypothetical protein